MGFEFDFVPNRVPVVTTCMGLFLVCFGLSSAVVKERLYLSESILTTAIGTIIGPFVLGLLVPQSWPDLNAILLEVSRLIIIMQIMAAIICLPARYYRLHWKSLLVLLGPVMICGWVITAGLIHWILGLSWPVSLAIGAALSPTDPILANSIVKGKFADKHVPRHVRNLISAESSANDATGALFVQLTLLQILHPNNPSKVATDFILWITLYQNVLGAVYGIIVGLLARRALKYAEKNDMIDMENFLAFSLALSIFVDGSAVLLYFNDFVSVVFAAIAFGWDGAFYEQSRHSPFQEILDNLSNAWFFVFNGTLIPWPTILSPSSVGFPQFWQHVVCSLAILAFRRIPITALCYPFLPSLTTIKEALFVGHFGPMAGGAVFYMAQMRGQLGPDLFPELEPTIQFVIVSSIIVHGVTVPLFKLGTVAVRSLSAGSSGGLLGATRTWSLPLVRNTQTRSATTSGGISAVSGPMNARPMYASPASSSPRLSEEGITLTASAAPSGATGLHGGCEITSGSPSLPLSLEPTTSSRTLATVTGPRETSIAIQDHEPIGEQEVEGAGLIGRRGESDDTVAIAIDDVHGLRDGPPENVRNSLARKGQESEATKLL